ncbi:MAG: ParB/RepB/Spo0J family partition protein [Bacteriovoracaceae bacterium]|nr:ParB/RepB/Spo0J family partition protein [Bacteriovoracaceae bacterium]
MAKDFSPRISKKSRETIDLSSLIQNDRFSQMEQGLLKNTPVKTVKLSEIKVKEQVRTKFYDESLQELAENIRTNGLIQPLVLHKEGETYTLLCGERRYRAMSMIGLLEAPCHVLENKSLEELMAIQFSENSSRENLHYVDKAQGIYEYQKVTGASEREIEKALGISKSEVHRGILIAKLPDSVKSSAKAFDIEKYVLLEWDALKEGVTKKKVQVLLEQGYVLTRTQLKKALLMHETGAKTELNAPILKRKNTKNISAAAFIKAMETKTDKLTPKAKEILRNLVEETRDMMDL